MINYGEPQSERRTSFSATDQDRASVDSDTLLRLDAERLRGNIRRDPIQHMPGVWNTRVDRTHRNRR